jgi:surface protein
MEDEVTEKLPNVVIIEWPSDVLPDDLWLLVLSHFDVKTLMEKKQVCRSWCHSCTEAMDAKQTMAFSTNQQLRQAVQKYCRYDEATESYSSQHQNNPQDAEEMAQTYGYPIDKWDVSNLQDFSNIFQGIDTFNEDISSWNVSNATSMRGMFYGATSFNQNLSSWNVSHVTDMAMMFDSATAFNNDGICRWDVSKVTDMMSMFYTATSFNQDLSHWNVSNVTDMTHMFYGATYFNQNVSLWNVSNVHHMARMFSNATRFDQDISQWNVSNVENMAMMFFGASSFHQDLSLWNISKYCCTEGMFSMPTSDDDDEDSNLWDCFQHLFQESNHVCFCVIL